jgi:hypothetical protein
LCRIATGQSFVSGANLCRIATRQKFVSGANLCRIATRQKFVSPAVKDNQYYLLLGVGTV